MGEPAFQTELERVLYEALASLLTCVEVANLLGGPKGHEVRKKAFAALAKARGE